MLFRSATTLVTVHVTQTPGSACGNYTATVDLIQYPWLHITSGYGGAPGTDVTFTADANLTATARVGVISISGQQNVTVTQAAAICNFAVTPTSQSMRSEERRVGK